MKPKVLWSILGFLFLVIFALTFMKTPEAIAALLTTASGDTKTYSVFVHIAFIVVLASGLLLARLRNILFSVFIAFLSLSATVVSVVYVIIPNTIIFAMYFVLIVQAYVSKKLSFPFKEMTFLDLMFGTLALFFGF